MDERRAMEADRLRAVPESQRPALLHEDIRWQSACWIHQRPVASLVAWTVPGALLFAFVGWGFMAGLDGGSHAVDWLLVVGPVLLALLVGLANWGTGAWGARRVLRQMGSG